MSGIEDLGTIEELKGSAQESSPILEDIGTINEARENFTPDDMYPSESIERQPYKTPEIENELLRTGDTDYAMKLSDGDLKWSLNLTQGMDPEEVSRLQRISETSNLPIDTIKRNKKMVEDRMMSKEAFSKLTERKKDGDFKYPLTLGYLSNPKAAAQFRDDYNNLAAIEEIQRNLGQRGDGFFKKLYRSGMSGAATVTSGIAKIPAAVYEFAALPQNLVARATGMDKLKAEAPNWTRENPLTKYYEDQAEAWRPVDLDKDFGEVLASKDLGEISNHILYQAVTNIPNLALMVGASVATGGAASLATMGAISAAERAAEGAKRNEDLVDRTISAVTYGGAEALFERYTLNMFKGIGGAVRKAFDEKVAKDIMTNVGKLVLSQTMGEGLSEAGTSAVQDFADITVGVNKNPSEVTLNLVNSFLVGGLTGGALGGGGVATHALNQVATAENGLKHYTKLLDASKVSQLFKRNKEAFTEYVDTIAKKTQTSNSFFMSMEAAGALFQEEDGSTNLEELETFFEEMGLKDQAKIAKETGTDLEVDMGSFIAKYGETEVGEKVKEHMKFEQGGLTKPEADVEVGEVQRKVAEMGRRKAEEKLEQETLPQELEPVKQSLIESGMSDQDAELNLKLVSSAANVFAKEYGISKEEYLKDKLGLEVQVRPETKEGDLYQDDGTIKTESEAFKSWFGEKNSRSKVVDESGAPKVVYSGHANVALYGDKFDVKKATAGGFYATEDPALAGSYATGKVGIKDADTSEGNQYRFKAKNGKWSRKLPQIKLTEEQIAKIEELKTLKDEYGNNIHSLAEMDRWIENNKDRDRDARQMSYEGSSNLHNIFRFYEMSGDTISYDKEGDTAFDRQQNSPFEDVLDALNIEWQSYEKSQPGVLPLYLYINKPIDTSKPFPEEVMRDLKEKAKRERFVSREDIDATRWTKDYPLRHWIEDINEGNEFWSTHIPAKAVPILKKHGYDGIKDTGGKGGGKEHAVWIALEPNQIKSVFNKGEFSLEDDRFLYQGKKGSIQFEDNKNTISLFEKADMSTFLHEAGHMFINEMDKIVKAGIASPQMVKDFITLKEYAGDYNTREGKEKLAQAFEKYLQTGEAPSTRLRKAFRKFRSWLNNIYKGIRRLNVKITPEVSNAFDRMIATDQDIAELEALKQDKEALLDNAKLTKKQTEELGKLGIEAREEAIEKRTAQVMRAYQKSLDASERLEAQATKDVDERKVYIASNKMIEQGGVSPTVLDFQYGKEEAKEVVKNFPGIKAGKQSYDIDLMEIAFESGYPTENEMMYDLRYAIPRKEAIAQQKEILRSELEGVIREEVEQEDIIPGEKAYYSDAQFKYLLKEIEVLAKNRAKERGVRVPKTTPARAYKEAAQISLSTEPVREAIRYKRYAQGSAKYSRIATEALRKKNFEAAQEAKEMQAQNQAYLLAAVENDKTVMKGSKKIRDTVKSKTVEPDYKDLITDIANKYGLTQRKPKHPDKIMADEIFGYLESEDNLDPIKVPEVLKTVQGNYKDLTMDQFEQLVDGISMLAARGRMETDIAKDLGKEFENISYEELTEKLVEPMQGRKVKLPPRKNSASYEALSSVNQVLGEIGLVNYDLKTVDGLKDLKPGVNSKVIYRTITEKGNDIARAENKFYKKIQDQEKIFRKLYKRMREYGTVGKQIEGVPVPEKYVEQYRTPGWTSEMILAVAFNTGNKGNLDSLKKGLGIDEFQVQQIVKELTTEEINAVQDVWNALDELFPEMEKTYRKINGGYLKKVDPKPITVVSSSGEAIELKGGYYPIAHDPALSRKVEGYTDYDKMMNEQNNTFGRHRIKESQTKERVGSSHAIDLTMRPLYKHVETTLRYTHLAKSLHDIGRLVRSDQYAETYTKLMGKDKYTALTSWLQSVARPGVMATSKLDSAIQKGQRNVALMAFAGNLSSSAKQFLSLTSTATEIGLGRTLAGAYRVMRDPVGMYKYINNMSDLMRRRAGNVEIGMETMIRESIPTKFTPYIGDKRLNLKAVHELAMIGIRAGDILGAYPTWIAAFDKARSEGKTETQAISEADSLVDDTQPVLLPEFKNAWQRGGFTPTAPGKMLRWVVQPFTGWTMKFGARNRAMYRGWKDGSVSNQKFFQHVLFERIASPMLSQLIVSMLSPYEDTDDVDGYVASVLLYQFAGLPLIGNIASAVRYGTMWGVTELPIADIIKKSAKGISGAIAGDFQAPVKATADIAQFWYGVPVSKAYSQMKKTIEAIQE